jgi:hypothetical protein
MWKAEVGSAVVPKGLDFCLCLSYDETRWRSKHVEKGKDEDGGVVGLKIIPMAAFLKVDNAALPVRRRRTNN